jgi:hypothetical protein
MEIYLDSPGGTPLAPTVTYDTTTEALPADPHFVQFVVCNLPGMDVLRADQASGFVMPLRLGHALIEASFGGVTALACVNVRQTYPRNVLPANLNCSDMTGSR